MAVKFRKQAVKFLQKARPEEAARIQDQINQLYKSVSDRGIIPFNELDIKKMKGKWEGFYRLRISKIRVVFIVELTASDIEIYAIGYRGDIYK